MNPIFTKDEMHNIIFNYIKPELDKYVDMGGCWTYGSQAGHFSWDLHSGVGCRYRDIGLMFLDNGEIHVYNDYFDKNDHSTSNIIVNEDSIRFVDNSKFKDFDRDFMYGLYEKFVSAMKTKSLSPAHKLFISQPMTGYNDDDIKKQRQALYRVFCQYKGIPESNVELIEQHMPNDPYDTDLHFSTDKERNFYRFCRSIGMMGKATDIILYGDWEKSRGCKLEVEILKEFGINILDQNLLIDFCIKNNKLDYLEMLWPEKAELLRLKTELKNTPTICMACVAIIDGRVKDDEIIVSHDSAISLAIPFVKTVYALKPAFDEKIIKLNVTRASDKSSFPKNKYGDIAYVSPKTASRLVMDLDKDIIHLIIPEKDLEISINKTLEETYPLCVIKDRYGGVYSGGEYTAWCCGIDYIPVGVFEDDVTCAHTWGELKADRRKGDTVYGVGETPDEALRDLAKSIIIRNSIIKYEEE